MGETKAKNPHAGHRKRMRERYEKNGFNGWSEHEVLEFILFDKIPRKDTNKIAHDILDKFGSIKNAISSDVESLVKIDGIGEATAKHILSQEKMYNYGRYERIEVKTKKYDPDNPYDFFCALFDGRKRETMYMVCLDIRGRVLRCDLVFEGTFESIDLNVGAMVRLAVTAEAFSVVLAHNHPNGNPEPSDDDIISTRIIKSAMCLVGVELLDHVIFTDEGCKSIMNKV